MNDRLKCRVWQVSEKRYLDWEYLRLCVDLGDILNRGSTQCQIVEQCTGLKDNNGKLIYENDIIKYQESMYDGENEHILICQIIFSGGVNENGYPQASFDLKKISDAGRVEKGSVMCWFNMRKSPKIIGNIHENPELLEGIK